MKRQTPATLATFGRPVTVRTDHGDYVRTPIRVCGSQVGHIVGERLGLRRHYDVIIFGRVVWVGFSSLSSAKAHIQALVADPVARKGVGL